MIKIEGIPVTERHKQSPVTFESRNGEVEEGFISSVSETYVFVTYYIGGSTQATHPGLLRWTVTQDWFTTRILLDAV